MSRRYKGGFISTTQPVTSLSQAQGIWTIDEQAVAQKAGQWPSVQGVDPYFENTTLLLNGDGTNGAQNNTFVDSSTNNFAITRAGTPTQGTFSPFSQTGWSGYFASNAYLSALADAKFNLTSTAFTVEAFIFVTGTTSSYAQWIVGKRMQTTPYNFSWNLTLAGTTPSVKFSGGSTDVTATVTCPTNTWVHVAASYDGTNISLYQNGLRVFDPTAMTIVEQTVPLTIGNYPIDNPLFQGNISNLRIVKGAAVYSGATYTVPTAPLTAIAGTSLLTLQDNRFKDNSTNNFTLTPSGTPKIQAFSPFNPTIAYSAAVVGGSGYFAGSDYLTLAAGASLNQSGDFTHEAWIFVNAYPSTNAPAIYGFENTNFLKISVNTAGKIIVDKSAVGVQATSATTLTIGSYYHVAIVRSGTGANNVKLYINGAQEAQCTGTDSVTVSGTGYIARSTGTTGIIALNGYVSNLRVTNTAVYTANFTPPTAPPTAISGTSLLLNFTNAGIVDATAKNDVTTMGDAQVSTAVKKFGTGSMKFDGTGDRLFTNGFPDFAVGTVFTVEFWMYPTASSGTICAATNGTSGLQIGYQNSTSFGLAAIGIGWRLTTALVPALNTWSFVQIVRSGTGAFQTTMYINNVFIAAATVTDAFTTATVCNIGNTSDILSGFSGYIDDLRVTKGVARPIALPTTAFPVY